MSLHLQSQTPLRVVSTTYAVDGSPVAALPFLSTELLAASTTNVNQLDIRTLPGWESGSLEIVIANAFLADNGSCDITITRPLGGGGMATIANLRAFHFLLTSDAITTAEIDSGLSADRDANISWTISNAAGSIIFAQGRLQVISAGDTSSASAVLPISYGADVKLVFELNLFSDGTRLQVLTAAE